MTFLQEFKSKEIKQVHKYTWHDTVPGKLCLCYMKLFMKDKKIAQYGNFMQFNLAGKITQKEERLETDSEGQIRYQQRSSRQRN